MSAPLLPEKAATVSQGEQVSQCLELLLLVLADVARVREGKPARLGPWAESLEKLAGSPIVPHAPQAGIFEALRNLTRNPSPESLLREISLTLRT